MRDYEVKYRTSVEICFYSRSSVACPLPAHGNGVGGIRQY